MLVESVPDAAQPRDHWWPRPGWGPHTHMLAWHLTFEGETALQKSVGQTWVRCIPP